MAWYNGLMPTFERITAGHRLVLHYQLIHTTNSPSPVLPSPSRAIDRLGKVLASWKKSVSDQDVPRKIVYLLEHKYSEANLTADGLKGRDAYILSVLKDVAQTEGFKLLLAHLELFAQGEASCGPRQKWGSRQYCHSDNDSDREETKGADPSRLKYQDPSDVEHELELSNLRTLDGTPVKDGVDLLEMLFPTEMKAVESIPGDLKAVLERGKPDSVNYDEPETSWMGGTLCRWFRRSVLIICPTEHYSPFIHGIVSSKDALDTLRSSSSTSPTEQGTSLVDRVLSAPGEYSKEELEDTLRVVTACACRWGDFELWRKAMDACQGWKGIYRVQSSGLLSALLSLPFNSVSQSVLRVITNDRTRSKRLSFAYAACQELKPVGLSATWILEALKADIKNIGSLKPSELDLLVMTTLSAGGMPGFEKHILTELKASSNPRCSVTIAYRLQQELSSADKSEEFSKEERSRAKRAINDLLSSAASDWEPYWNEFEQPNPLFLLGRAAVRQPSADVPVQLIKAAVESKNVGLIKTLTLKLTDVPERGDQVEVSPKDAVRLVAFPTLKEIVKYLQDNPPEESLSNVVRQLKRGLSQVALEHRDSHRHDLPIIFQAVGEQLDADYLQNDLVPQFCKLHHDLSAYEAFCRQLGVWKNESSDPELRETIDNSIKHLLKTAANNSKSQYTHAPLLVERILKLCAQVGVVDFCSYIFSRLAEQAATVITQHPDNYVIASLGTFGQWLLEGVVSAWRKKTLGPMPAGITPLLSAINAITCACQHCGQVKSYLWVLNPYEKRLNQIGRMRKSDETIQSLVWLGKKRSGLEALQGISEDEVTLKQVLGEDEYQHILVALHIDYINAPLPAAPVQQAESSLSAASASTRRSSASAGNERPAKRRKITTA
ncbi:hypothetical protein FRC04_005940 [Tulasnella sp. 424]|nr:hypothetical protein FRC04_005940 [Tulasnella sp. 424]